MTQADRISIATGSGVALWRQIADSIRSDIAGRELPPDTPLKPEQALAAQYGVNRHTVRAAIRALREEGVLRAEQGRGTFVAAGRRLSYRLGPRTRLSESLSGQADAPSAVVLSHKVEPGEAQVIAALGLRAGAALLRIEVLSRADERPLSRSTHWLAAARFTGLGEEFAALGSITPALARRGIADYVRHSTIVSARAADAEEARSLDLAPGATVLVSRGLDAEADGTPVQLVISRFPAARVELVIGEPAPG